MFADPAMDCPGLFVSALGDDMKRPALALLMLSLAMLACSLSEPTANLSGTVATETPHPSPAPSLFSTKPSPSPQPITPGECTVTAESLHIRDAPTVDGHVIGWLFAGDVADIESTRGAWYEVTTSRGAGYVHSHFCEIQNEVTQ